MTFTPSSLLDFVTYFESNNLDPENPFYYEASSATINFGYGINLTSAEQLAISGNSTLKNDLIAWFAANNIAADQNSVAGVSWSSFSTASLSAGGGATVADTLTR